MVPADSLEERMLDVASCDTVDLWALPDALKKRKQWGSHIQPTRNVLHAEHLISKICGVTSIEVPFSVSFVLQKSSQKSPSWPSICLGRGKLSGAPSSDYQLMLGPKGLLLGFVGWKKKDSHFSKLSGKWLTCFLWSFPPCGSTSSSSGGKNTFYYFQHC